jgi:drug/metabolite transporter (DMT)-like permease
VLFTFLCLFLLVILAVIVAHKHGVYRKHTRTATAVAVAVTATATSLGLIIIVVTVHFSFSLRFFLRLFAATLVSVQSRVGVEQRTRATHKIIIDRRRGGEKGRHWHWLLFLVIAIVIVCYTSVRMIRCPRY